MYRIAVKTFGTHGIYEPTSDLPLDPYVPWSPTPRQRIEDTLGYKLQALAQEQARGQGSGHTDHRLPADF